MLTKEQKKKTGSTFTPEPLATFLATELFSNIDTKKVSVLDPACGDGELLIAISKVLSRHNISFSITGYDSNDGALNTAQNRLLLWRNNIDNLIHGDFLESRRFNTEQQSLFCDDKVKNESLEMYDMIIANPPYVRTQHMGSEQSRKLAQIFNLSGRVDLYHAFLVAMSSCLKVGGLMGVITSNRFLTTQSGQSTRQFLSKHFDLIEVFDLGDTKLFDAAVLPAIIIAKKKANQSISPSSKFTKVYEASINADDMYTSVKNVYDLLNTKNIGNFITDKKSYRKTQGEIKINPTGEIWQLVDNDESDWVTKINKRTHCFVGDLFKVKVGIKTTADKVFIRDDWEKLGDSCPENSLLKLLISQENVSAWSAVENTNLKILYPHISVNGKKQTINLSDYPKASKYFTENEERLKSRTYVIESGRKWFEIWVPQNPDLWKNPKLVFPDISNTPRFYFDEGGMLVNGNCYYISAKKQSDKNVLLLIQGIANSELMTKYHDLLFNNKLYSGRRRYLTQYVEKYPLPNPDSPEAIEIISVVKELNSSTDPKNIIILEEKLNCAVNNAFLGLNN